MDKMYDVIVVGGGPAGLTAALYLARAKYRVLVVEKAQFGGQISITHEVVNYPGIETTSGMELAETMRRQAEVFDSEFLMAEVTGIACDGEFKTVHTDHGDITCHGILIATGARPRLAGFVGEEQYKGRGVAYCATCDGELFTGKEIYVVGGGYAAAEESVFLTRYASHVTILIRKEDFSCAKSVADRAKHHEKITVLTNTVLERVAGDHGLQEIRYRNTATGQVTEKRAPAGESFGVFVFAGAVPATELVRDLVELDERGYVLTDASQKTSADGIYAAGDVCVKPLRQVTTAVGDGALAAASLEKCVAQRQETTGVRAQIWEANSDDGENMTQVQKKEKTNTGFSLEIDQQLKLVFDGMKTPLQLHLILDNRPISAELEQLIRNLAAQSEKLSVTVEEAEASNESAPCVSVRNAHGEQTGLAFHGVPSGHEFSSFVLGLYHAAGGGQAIGQEERRRIHSLKTPLHMKILVTLSCSMCPDLVIAAQKIALESPAITAEIFDIRHFDHLRERYQVMSVPCLIINDEAVSFGRKNLDQLLQLLEDTVGRQT